LIFSVVFDKDMRCGAPSGLQMSFTVLPWCRRTA